MTADLVTRLLAGPGSRELDAEVALACDPRFAGWVRHPNHAAGPSFMTGELWPSAEAFANWRDNNHDANCAQAPHYTTSIDAAVAFAVAVVGAERALCCLRCSIYTDEYPMLAQATLDALPRYIVAEVLKARGDD